MAKKILVFSDVHLNHKKTPTKYIIDNIRKYIHDVIYKESIDCVFIAGDLFDSLMYLNNIELNSIISWISTFLNLCMEKNTSIRVLEGTPSHDWKQSRLFDLIIGSNQSLYKKLDFKYHDDLTIEYVDKLKMNVLYIPDEYGLTAEYTFNKVLEKLEEHNLSKVDLVIMHGLFDFQEIGPTAGNKATHKSLNYLNICNHYVFVGHSHVHTFYKRILVEGSFDRLAHGEESAKGFIVATLNDDPTNDEFYFMENKDAKIYKTIEIRSTDIEKAINQVERHINKLPKGSHLRMLVKSTNPIYNNIDIISKNYPDYFFTKKPIKDDEPTIKTKIEKVNHSGITINQTTLKGIILDKMNTIDADPDIKKRAIEQLNEFL
jgi:DNA repair exonuclease SbcCD nuclease subunit